MRDSAYGLVGMRERADVVEARISIDSSPGEGTTVTVVAGRSDGEVTPAGPPRAGAARGRPAPAAVGTSDGGGAAARPGSCDHGELSAWPTASCWSTTTPCSATGSGAASKRPARQVVGEAANGEEALELAIDLRPDVIVMDLTMPVLDGIGATKRIRQEVPEAKVVVLTMHDDVDATRRPSRPAPLAS